MSGQDKPLVYKIVKMRSNERDFTMVFDIEVQDEHTLQVLERQYKHKLTFDGGRTFTLHNLTVPLKGAAEAAPELWEKIKTDEDLMGKFVLARLKGEI